MSQRFSAALALLLVLAVASLSLARQAGPTTEDQVAAPTDPAIQDLLSDFNNLYNSLRNSGGIREADRPIILRFRERVQAELAERPGDRNLLALDLQLSSWLQEEKQVEAAYQRLIAATDGDQKFVQAWLDHVRGKGDPDAVNRAYETLIAEHPENKQLKLDWARFLRSIGRYDEALELFEASGFQPADAPDTAYAMAECQAAAHQFAAALETLNAIPESAFIESPSLKARVDLFKGQIEQAIVQWAAEEELRAAEAKADDLPRVEIVTDRGPIVLELYEDQAPNTVANFITLAEQGFYDSTKIGRVQPGVSVEAGDPVTRSEGDRAAARNPGYRIPDEFGGDDARRHFTGTISMISGPVADTGGCLFLITMRPMPERDGRFTAFGRVIEGMDVARQLQMNDRLDHIEVLRKREHAYEADTLPLQLTPTTPDEDTPSG